MLPMNIQHDLSQLRLAGWEDIAIKRLACFQRAYRQTELDQAPLDPKRLAFVRWLVTTGRLTEPLPEVPHHQHSILARMLRHRSLLFRSQCIISQYSASLQLDEGYSR